MWLNQAQTQGRRVFIIDRHDCLTCASDRWLRPLATTDTPLLAGCLRSLNCYCTWVDGSGGSSLVSQQLAAVPFYYSLLLRCLAYIYTSVPDFWFTALATLAFPTSDHHSLPPHRSSPTTKVLASLHKNKSVPRLAARSSQERNRALVSG